MRALCVVPVVLSDLMGARAATAESQTVAVSPGDPSKLVLVGDRCPTFSWGQVDGASRGCGDRPCRDAPPPGRLLLMPEDHFGRYPKEPPR